MNYKKEQYKDLPLARNEEIHRPSLGQVLDLAIYEKNAVNFIFLKKWVSISNLDKIELLWFSRQNQKVEEKEKNKKRKVLPSVNGVSLSPFYLIKSTYPFLSQSKIVIHQQKLRIWKRAGVEYQIIIIL